jgi:hypothetical protein
MQSALRSMATQQDVRRIALSLPRVEEHPRHFRFSLVASGKRPLIAWVWNERVSPKAPKVPNPGVVAIRVADAGAKQVLLGADPTVFFTKPHYDGYPAILVRLKKIHTPLLERLLRESWRCLAPPGLLRAESQRSRLGGR